MSYGLAGVKEFRLLGEPSGKPLLPGPCEGRGA